MKSRTENLTIKAVIQNYILQYIYENKTYFKIAEIQLML